MTSLHVSQSLLFALEHEFLVNLAEHTLHSMVEYFNIFVSMVTEIFTSASVKNKVTNCTKQNVGKLNSGHISFVECTI